MNAVLDRLPSTEPAEAGSESPGTFDDPGTRIVAPDEASGLLATQQRAEASFWHTTLVGAVSGLLVCAGLWMAIVAVALVGAGWSLGPPLAMATCVGIFAGAFLGGWAGVMVAAGRLEAAEQVAGAPSR